ncbi:replication initiation and membrane attachment family protein [Domibacillus epiphyticus]|uniref:Replication initiation and membrane attachment protein n=1 Tax=Domibacillus epiphyticus TaxID=1714355 RepID=A0A1V2A902_9BACI|nr:DnaD domain protein [Domibacillus epiphyticus]OMP67479.1 Replication initiation and membrane attachment protein [Domibacillus epiphyticus]
MNRHWNEMQPADGYTVSLFGCIDSLERKVIALLYQPLVGAQAVSLYMTMCAEVEDGKLSSGGAPHYHLMNTLGCSPQQIYEDRLKLEGIGLLKTYVKRTDSTREFLYEIQPPLPPDQFFSDGLLNVFLYRKIGRPHFLRLKQMFCDKEVKTADFLDVTHDFPDVFTTSYTDGKEAEMDSVAQPGSRFAKNGESSGPVLAHTFDFSALELTLKDALIPKSALTPYIKETIKKLSFLYGIQPLEMKNLVLSAINEHDEIDVEELRKSARDAYQFESGGRLPDMTPRNQSVPSPAVIEPKTQEEKLIHYLETVSPRQLLIDISGSVPSKSDMQIIEQVMLQYNLEPGVANVLIQYVMLKTDMKLSKSYVDKIASHWARKKVKTVVDAMNLAKSEQRQYDEWAKNKDKPKASGNRKTTRQEKLPAWFTEQKEEKETVDHSFEEEKRKLEEALRKRTERAPAGEKD